MTKREQPRFPRKTWAEVGLCCAVTVLTPRAQELAARLFGGGEIRNRVTGQS